MGIQPKKFTDVVSYPVEHVVNRRVYGVIGPLMHKHPWWDKLPTGEVREQIITGVLIQMVSK